MADIMETNADHSPVAIPCGKYFIWINIESMRSASDEHFLRSIQGSLTMVCHFIDVLFIVSLQFFQVVAHLLKLSQAGRPYLAKQNPGHGGGGMAAR